MKKDGIDERSATTTAWTRVETYLRALARGRAERRQRQARAARRTEPENPRLTLSTLPFLALIIALGLLFVTIAVLAWPTSEQPRPRAAAERELGTAPAGWLEKAEQEMNGSR